jgi:hypothetical protein
VCEELLVNSLRTSDISKILDLLDDVFKRVHDAIDICDTIETVDMETIKNIINYPWLDEEILSSDIGGLKFIYLELNKYNCIERNPGYYYVVEIKAKEYKTMQHIESCKVIISNLKREIYAKSV